MPARTIFLSKLIWLYSLLIGLSMLSHREATIQAVDGMMHSPPLVLLAGVIALMAGLAIILSHNLWSGGALPVIVTLAGWISLIKGLLLLLLTPNGATAYFAALQYDQLFYLYMSITLAIGIYLTYSGFKPGSR